jgi:prepilin-type processing-associated H-X9-DG protein
VELLVVIGIIAILIAILLPTIAAAQRTAKTTGCLANIRSIGQALKIYQAENKGSYPFAYYISQSSTGGGGVAAAGDGGTTDLDARTYVWWSVVRGVMRGRGFPMDNSIRSDDGGTLTRFMAAFNCPTGNNRDAGCDFSGNAAIMIIEADEKGGFGHTWNRRFAKPLTEKLVPADCVVIWDAPELGPNFNTQYVASYYVDVEHYPSNSQAGRLLSSPGNPKNRYRNLPLNEPDNATSDSGVIDPGVNRDIATGGDVSRLAGNIRWRHGRNDQANFLFGDGSAKTFRINQKVSGTGQNSVYRGDVIRKMFRPKIPPNYRYP